MAHIGSGCVRMLSCVVLLSTVVLKAGAEVGDMGPYYFQSVTVFAGQGVDHNLRELPGRLLVGDLAWERSYMHALGFQGGHRPLGKSWVIFDGTMLADVTQGYELVLAKHRGRQDNIEVGVACTLKTPARGFGDVRINLATGIGLSYALGTPSYEDGAIDDPERRYRLQLLLLFDLEWSFAGMEEWALLTRVHHRSGGYGLIAPPHVGSNFLAAGIRYSF